MDLLFAVHDLLTDPGEVPTWVSLVEAVAILLYLAQPSIREQSGRRPAGS